MGAENSSIKIIELDDRYPLTNQRYKNMNLTDENLEKVIN